MGEDEDMCQSLRLQDGEACESLLGTDTDRLTYLLRVCFFSPEVTSTPQDVVHEAVPSYRGIEAQSAHELLWIAVCYCILYDYSVSAGIVIFSDNG